MGVKRNGAMSVGSLVLCMVIGTSVSAGDWPQWRGENHDGISSEVNLPATWSETEGLAWKLDLPGAGGASPVVSGDRIFLTTGSGDQFELWCVSTKGKPLWKQPMGGGNSTVRGDEGNGASASPSTDGKGVWAMVSNGTLACFSVAGKPIWKVDLQARYGAFNIQFGMTSTPILDGNRLYLQLIHSGGGTVICLDKASGKEVWKVKRESDGTDENEHSYASPTLWRKGKDAYLITHGNDYAVAAESAQWCRNLASGRSESERQLQQDAALCVFAIGHAGSDCGAHGQERCRGGREARCQRHDHVGQPA